MENHETRIQINWIPPEPRDGFLGSFDKFIGPGATKAEVILQFVTAFAAGVLVIFYAILAEVGWSVLQYVLAIVIALDMVGGVVTNATASGKRWYHREGQGFKQHFGFVIIHAFQLLLVVIFFRSGDWLFFVILYGYLLIATLIILRSPLYLQRPVALILYIGALLMNCYVFTPTIGLEWFVPIFFLKLLISHVLKEAPYVR